MVSRVPQRRLLMMPLLWRKRCCESLHVFVLILILIEFVKCLPIFPTYKVDKCPANESAWMMSSERLNCSTTPLDNRYHCMPNREKSSLFEFCYDKDRLKVVKGHCVELVSNGFIDVNEGTKCESFVGYTCPDKTYNSDKLYLYPGCSKINTVEKCYTSDPSCSEMRTVTTETVTVIESTYTQKMNVTTVIHSVNNTSTTVTNESANPDRNDFMEPDHHMHSAIGITLGVIFPFVSVGLFIVVCYLVRHKKKRKDVLECPTVKVPLLKDPPQVLLKEVLSVELNCNMYGKIPAVITLNGHTIVSTTWKKIVILDEVETPEVLSIDNMKYTEEINGQDRILIIHDVEENDEAFYQLEVEFEDNQIVSSDRAQLFVLKDDWLQMDKDFVEISACEEVRKKMEIEHTLLIVGSPKTGKTAFAQHIASNILKSKTIIVHRPQDVVSLVTSDNQDHMVILYENLFGKCYVNLWNLFYFIYHGNLICKMLANVNSVKLIMTCRNEIYNEVKYFRCFAFKNIVDLDEVQNVSNEDKKEIFKKHCFLPTELADSSEFHCSDFHRICHLFGMDLKHEVNDKFYDDACRFLCQYLDSLQLKDSFTFIALLLCSINHNTLSSYKLKNEREMVEKVIYSRNSNISGDLQEVIQNVFEKCKNETFFRTLSHNSFEYHTLYSECIHEILTLIICKKQTRFAWQLLDRSYILNLMRNKCPFCSSHDNCSELDLDAEFYQLMAHHIALGMESPHLSWMYDLFKSPWWEIAAFRDEFFSSVSKQQLKEMFLKDYKFCIPTCETSLESFQDEEFDSTEINHFEILFSIENSGNCMKTVLKTKLIYWLVSFGKKDVLKELFARLSRDEIFGTDFTDHMHWLVLSCFNTVSIVEIILNELRNTSMGADKYVNMDFSRSNIFVKDKNKKMRPFHIATAKDNLEIMKYLFANGASVDGVDDKNRSPIFIASEKGNRKALEYLINNGGTLSLANCEQKTPLYQAVKKGHYGIVEYLADKGANVNHCDDNDVTPVALASKQGDHQIVSILLRKNAEINKFDKLEEKTPLHLASRNGFDKIVKLLLKNKAKVNKKDKEGKSALCIASINKHERTVDRLLQKQTIDIDSLDKNHMSALHYAAKVGCFNIVKKLIRAKGNLHIADVNERSPLHEAAENGHLAVVEHLVRNGAIVNKCDKDGKSPLYLATFQKHLDIVEFLCKHDADVNISDINQTSPVAIASEKGYSEIFKLLLDQDAVVNSVNNSGQAPFNT